MLRFDWDERKNKANRAKHGIWFEEAQSVFDDPRALLFCDPDHPEEEERFIFLGVSSAGRTCCGALLQGVRRIISHYFGKKGEQEGGESL